MAKRICGAQGEDDTCNLPLAHPGPHKGRRTGKEWPRDPGRVTDYSPFFR